MKKKLFYAGLVFLPLIGYGIDLWEQGLRTQLSQTFTFFPANFIVILADLIFAGVAIWLARQTSGMRMPAGIAAIVMILGMAVACIPLLISVSLSASASFFVTWLPVHRSIAGAFLFLTGLAALIWKPKTSAV